ncbi:MAG: YbaB/EbfC family nucleoid-associated protein [Deltaproteobacteria bacterium]|nr:YbaB/EbfC family nucleoid-associated protein [Deltaproteobacteria bacterium]
MAKGMGNMMKQAQKLQSKIFKLQEELADRTVETTVGGGMVKVVANGKQELLSIKIEPEVKSQEMVSEEMTKLTGGFKIPGLT